MSFSDDAIGFFLTLDDQLSPALATAETNYARFVKSLDKHNQQAFRSANQGMAALADVVDGFKELPKVAEKAYDDAMRRMRDKSKPITQTINLELSGRSKQELAKTIGEAVAKVLSKVTVRLSAAVPLRKSKLFDTTVALRRAYKGQVQPPDMAGMFQGVPRFAKGGMVEGPSGVDKVLAFLSKGELVLPADLSEQFLKLVGAQENEILGLAEQSFVETVADMQNIAKALERINDLTESGLDPTAIEHYAGGVAALNAQYDQMREALKHIGQKDFPIFLNIFKEAGEHVEKFTKGMEGANDQIQETGKTANTLLKRILGPARFLAIHTALTDVQAKFQSLTSSVGATFSTLDGDQVGNFVDNINQMNQRLGLSRAELRKFKLDAVDTLDKTLPAGVVNLTEFSAVLEAGAAAGQKNRDTLLRLAPAVSAMAKASTATSEALAQTAVKLQSLTGFDENQIAAIFEKTRVTARETFSDTGQLIEQMSKLTESAGNSFLKLTTDQQAAFINNLTGLSASMQDVWGDNAGAISQLIADAFRGNVESIQQFTAITGRDFGEVRKTITESGGDLSFLVGDITDKFQDLGDVGFEVFRDALNVPLTNEELGSLVKNQDVVTAKMHQLQSITVDSSNALESLGEAARANQTVFENLKNRVGTAIASFQLFGISGAEVLDFLKEMPPSLIYSGLEVAKFGVQLLAVGGQMAFAGVKALFFSGAQAAANAAAIASAPASTVMATGVMALLPAIPVLLAVSAAILAIGGAVKLAERPLTALVDVLGSAVKGVTQIVVAMTTMSPGALLSLAGALLALGPAFLGMGTGILAMSVELVAAVPGLALFAGALKLMGVATGTSGSFADVINAMVVAFAVDPGMMRRAVESIGLTVTFLAGFAAAAVELTALALGASIGEAVGLLIAFFGGKSPLKSLTDQARVMRTTVSTLAGTFGDISQGEMDQFRKAGETFAVMGAFMRDYTNTVKIVQGSAPNFLIEKVSVELRKAWQMQGPFGRLSSQAGQMRSTVRNLAATFGKVPQTEMDQLKVASERMKAIAEFVDRYAFVAEVLDDIDSLLVQEGVMGMLSYFGNGSPFENLRAQSAGIVEVVADLLDQFGGRLPQVVDEAKVNTALTALSVAGRLVSGLKPILESTKEAGDLAGALEDGAWYNLWLADGPLTNLAEIAPEIRTTMEGLVKEFNLLDSNVGSDLSRVTATLKGINVTVTGVAEMAKGVRGLAADLEGFSVRQLDTTTKRAGSIIRIARRVQNAFLDTEAKIETLQPAVEARVTPAQIQEVITVKLDPNTTDEPVRAELQRTNKLLEALLAAQGAARTTPAKSPQSRGQAGQGTRDLARGHL